MLSEIASGKLYLLQEAQCVKPRDYTEETTKLKPNNVYVFK